MRPRLPPIFCEVCLAPPIHLVVHTDDQCGVFQPDSDHHSFSVLFLSPLVGLLIILHWHSCIIISYPYTVLAGRYPLSFRICELFPWVDPILRGSNLYVSVAVQAIEVILFAKCNLVRAVRYFDPRLILLVPNAVVFVAYLWIRYNRRHPLRINSHSDYPHPMWHRSICFPLLSIVVVFIYFLSVFLTCPDRFILGISHHLIELFPP